MSDDASEKPFEPTPQRLAKAVRDGDAPRTPELGANVAFAAAAATIVAGIEPAQALAAAALRDAARGAAPWFATGALAALATLPLAACAAGGAAAAVAQGGGVRVRGVKLSWERIDVVAGIKRTFSRETLAHAARACVAFTVAACACAIIVLRAAAAMVAASQAQIAATVAWRAIGTMAGAAVAIGSAFAIAEYAAARRTWMRKLRMSPDERRREAKENDGDPLARGRRRALHRALARGGMARVKDAAFVVVNPTHVAVALEYGPPAVPVPRVLLKAHDAAALLARRVARAHGVPVVENASLARGLFASCATGEPIAVAHYATVAEVVAALLRSGSL